jgi:hypothetical protein
MEYFKRYRVLLIRGKLAWKSDRRYFKRFWERERVAGSGNARAGKAGFGVGSLVWRGSDARHEFRA